MELTGTVILPLVSALKPHSFKEIQLEACLDKALIRVIYRVAEPVMQQFLLRCATA